MKLVSATTLLLQAECRSRVRFRVHSYASDMMWKFAPGLADSYLSSVLWSSSCSSSWWEQ